MTVPPGHLQLEWLRLFLEGVVHAGVRSVVLSPGSRSAPLVLAATEIADLSVRHFIDERSAAFFALGEARASDRPSALVCTSGSAAGHYLPAILEASSARLPMLVLTADRPLDLQHCGASQTTDQVKLYGSAVRAYYELGVAVAEPRALRAARRLGVIAAARCLAPEPGPVHVNVRAVKPLEPESTPPPEQLRGIVQQVRERPAMRLDAERSGASEAAIDAVDRVLRGARRPLAIAGPGPLSRAAEPERRPIFELLRAARIPLCAESTSQLRFAGEEARGVVEIPELSLAAELPALRRRLRPDLVLQLGSFPVAPQWERWLAERPPEQHVVLGDGALSDPAGTATVHLGAPLAELCARLGARAVGRPDSTEASAGDADWQESLLAVCGTVRTALEHTLEQLGGRSIDDTEQLLGSEARVVRSVLSALPAGSLLAVGNSLPVRWVDLWADDRRRDLRVWCQRGLAGIDGVISGVAGSLCSLESERLAPPAAALLIGDASALHDAGGMACLDGVRTPLAIVVVNNGGGRIFEQLPIAQAVSSDRLEHFTTPHDLRLEGLAATWSVPYRRVTSPDALDSSLRDAVEGSGARVIEVAVAPGAAAAERELLAHEVRRAVGMSIGSCGSSDRPGSVDGGSA